MTLRFGFIRHHRCRLQWLVSLALLLVAPVFVADAAGADAAAYIRVATFNVANFGATDEYERSLISLVNIVRGMKADIVCVQEVEPSELGKQQVARLTELLNVAADFDKTASYQSVVSEKGVGDELTGFLWRAPVVLKSDVGFLPNPKASSGKRTFQRIPTLALFTAGNFDFYVVNCHLYTKVRERADGRGSSAGREAECAALAAWLKSLASEAEKDAIVVGDFNRFLNGRSDWPQLMFPGCEGFFRFALLEAIQRDAPSFNPLTDEAPEDRYSTTASKKRSIYDQVIISKGSYYESTPAPRFGEDVGIVAFDDDDSYRWFMGNWHLATKILSDHRPVWVRLRIDQPDDD